MNRNKLKSLIIGTTISAAVFIPKTDVYATEIQHGKVVNVDSNLRIRQHASIDSEIVGHLSNNTVVEIEGKSGNWYNIKFGNEKGYVSADYLKVINEENNKVSCRSSKTGYVTNVSTSLRVRQQPSTSSNVIDFLKNGQAVKITGEHNDWYKVNVNGKDGYVYKEYITFNVESNTNHNSNASNQVTNNGDYNVTNLSSKSTIGYVTNVSTSLRLRQGPSTSSNIIDFLKNDQKLTIKGEQNGWYKVEVNGKEGYVSKEYVRIESNNNSNHNNNSSSNNSSNSAATINKPGYVVNVSTSLRLRQGPSTSSNVIDSLKNGQTLTVKEEKDGWYKVEVNGKEGYVSKEYVKIGTNNTESNHTSSNNNSSNNVTDLGSVINKEGYVVNVSTSLRLRQEPSTDSNVIDFLKNGQTLTVKEEKNGWYKVHVNGKDGYVSKEYVKIGVSSNPSHSSSSNSSSTSSTYEQTYQKVFNAMKSQIGVPYVYGGSTPGVGFDCSGLMQWGFAQAGIQISRTTYTQLNDGEEIAVGDVRPGDLLFYSNKGHVGMYIGNSQWIEAPKPGQSVKIEYIPWSHIGYARRIIK